MDDAHAICDRVCAWIGESLIAAQHLAILSTNAELHRQSVRAANEAASDGRADLICVQICQPIPQAHAFQLAAP